MAEVPHDELRPEGAQPDHGQIERERPEHRHEVSLLQRSPDLVRMADRDDHGRKRETDSGGDQSPGTEATVSHRGVGG